ncbi:MAG TPA: prepilin peptidase [Candidatus Paceibacterota bacterium]|nr:prepilin peptidase [Candidatus Paceibacterota bacterium]
MDLGTLLSVAAALLGVIFGSFLNALSYRFNTGRGMGGRSYCDTCGHTLGALDLVPVLSYVFLGGRCRYCSARISIQNPLVEVAAGALSVGVYILHPNILGYAFGMLMWMTLLFVVIYDIRHTVIPWSCSGLLFVLAALSLFVSFDGGVHAVLPTMLAVAAGPLLALPLTLLSLVSGGRWMGWADGILELSLGWILGITLGATALMLAFWSGAAAGVLLIGASKLWRQAGKRFTMGSELPFAPFLVLGFLVAYFFHVDFFSSLAVFWQ